MKTKPVSVTFEIAEPINEDLKKWITQDIPNWWESSEGFYYRLLAFPDITDALIAECYETHKVIFCVEGEIEKEFIFNFIHEWSIWPIKYILLNGLKIETI